METQSPLADLLSLSALSLLLLSIHPSYLLFSFSVHQSHHLCSTSSRCSPFPLFISSWGSFFVFSSLLFLGPPLFFSPAVLLSPSVRHLCRLEFVGPRQKVFLFFSSSLFIFILSVQVEHRREGKQHPGPPDQYLLRIWGDLGTDLLLQLFPSCLSVVVFEFFFKIATSGMLNKDWWMFPNCVSLTLSATTTSRCFFIQIPFFPSWLAHLNFSVSL